MLALYIRQEVIHAICWTLIHSLWQGIVAAMLAGMIVICTRKSPVIMRYRLLTMTLLLFVVTVGITFATTLPFTTTPSLTTTDSLPILQLLSTDRSLTNT